MNPDCSIKLIRTVYRHLETLASVVESVCFGEYGEDERWT